jgi:hypothetical protein
MVRQPAIHCGYGWRQAPKDHLAHFDLPPTVIAKEIVPGEESRLQKYDPWYNAQVTKEYGYLKDA